MDRASGLGGTMLSQTVRQLAHSGKAWEVIIQEHRGTSLERLGHPRLEGWLGG